MSLTLSPPVRVAAFVGALVLTGLAAVVLLLGRGLLGDDPKAVATPTPAVKTAHEAREAARSAAPARAESRPSGLPAKIDHALRHYRVVVVSVSVPGGGVDAILRREARTAARTARAGFVAISVANERAVSGLVAKTGVLPTPGVVVVKRPGIVASTFSVTDAATIAQAAVQARR